MNPQFGQQQNQRNNGNIQQRLQNRGRQQNPELFDLSDNNNNNEQNSNRNNVNIQNNAVNNVQNNTNTNINISNQKTNYSINTSNVNINNNNIILHQHQPLPPINTNIQPNFKKEANISNNLQEQQQSGKNNNAKSQISYSLGGQNILQLNPDSRSNSDIFMTPRDQINISQSVNQKLLDKSLNQALEISTNQGGFTSRQQSQLLLEIVNTDRPGNRHPNSPKSIFSKQGSKDVGSIEDRKSCRKHGTNLLSIDGNNNNINNEHYTFGDSTRNLSQRMGKAFQNVNNNNGKQKWNFIKFMKIVTKIKKFMNNSLIPIIQKKQMDSLTDKQLGLIGDVSYFREKKEKDEFQHPRNFNEKLQYFVQCVSNSIECIPLIQPNNRLKIIADCWQSCLVIYRMFVTTIKLSFFLFDNRGAKELVDIQLVMVINLSFAFDIIVSFNTGFYEKGIIVTDRKRIALNYLKKTFISDILAQIPLLFAYVVTNQSSDAIIIVSYYLEFLIFLKWFSLKNVFSRLERVITENESMAAWFPLVSLLVNVLIIAHVVGLLWNLCAHIEIYALNSKETWLHMQPLDTNYVYIDSHWTTVYVAAFYWAVCTMVTILLYIPNTNMEIVFSVLAMFICAGCFGYALNTIGNILNDINRKNNLFKEERVRINRFIKKNTISANLKERIQLYIDYLHEQEKEKDQQEELKVLDRLSEHLKKEVQMEMFSNVITKYRILTDNFSEETIKETMLNLSLETFSPGDIIIQQEDIEKLKLQGYPIYYIEKGEVELSFIQNKKKRVFQVLKPGALFGVIEFFTCQNSLVTYTSSHSCSLYKIKRENFLSILEDKTDDYEIFKMMQNDMSVLIQHPNSYVDSLNVVMCDMCGLRFHQSHQCPNVLFQPSIKKVIYDYNHLGTQLRIKYDRSNASINEGCNVLKQLRDIQAAAEKIFEFTSDNEDEDLVDQALQWREFYIGLNEEENENSQSYSSDQEEQTNNNNIEKDEKLRDKRVSGILPKDNNLDKNNTDDKQYNDLGFHDLQQEIDNEKQDISEVEEDDDDDKSSGSSSSSSRTSSYLTSNGTTANNNKNTINISSKKNNNNSSSSKNKTSGENNSNNKKPGVNGGGGQQLNFKNIKDDEGDNIKNNKSSSSSSSSNSNVDDDSDSDELIEMVTSQEIAKKTPKSGKNKHHHENNLFPLDKKHDTFLNEEIQLHNSIEDNINKTPTRKSSQKIKRSESQRKTIANGQIPTNLQIEQSPKSNSKNVTINNKFNLLGEDIPAGAENINKGGDITPKMFCGENPNGLSPHFSKIQLNSPYKKPSEKRKQKQSEIKAKQEYNKEQLGISANDSMTFNGENSISLIREKNESNFSTRQQIRSNQRKQSMLVGLQGGSMMHSSQRTNPLGSSTHNNNNHENSILKEKNRKKSFIRLTDIPQRKTFVFGENDIRNKNNTGNYGQKYRSSKILNRIDSMGMSSAAMGMSMMNPFVAQQLHQQAVNRQYQQNSLSNLNNMGESRRSSIKINQNDLVCLMKKSAQQKTVQQSRKKQNIQVTTGGNFSPYENIDTPNLSRKSTVVNADLTLGTGGGGGTNSNKMINALHNQQPTIQQDLKTPAAHNTPIQLRINQAQEDLQPNQASATNQIQSNDNWFEWDLLNFDKLKEFHMFYPRNNLVHVLNSMPKPKQLEKKLDDKVQRKIDDKERRAKEIRDGRSGNVSMSNISLLDVGGFARTSQHKRSKFQLSNSNVNNSNILEKNGSQIIQEDDIDKEDSQNKGKLYNKSNSNNNNQNSGSNRSISVNNINNYNESQQQQQQEQNNGKKSQFLQVNQQQQQNKLRKSEQVKQSDLNKIE